jgi:hypothetical protein
MQTDSFVLSFRTYGARRSHERRAPDEAARITGFRRRPGQTSPAPGLVTAPRRRAQKRRRSRAGPSQPSRSAHRRAPSGGRDRALAPRDPRATPGSSPPVAWTCGGRRDSLPVARQAGRLLLLLLTDPPCAASPPARPPAVLAGAASLNPARTRARVDERPVPPLDPPEATDGGNAHASPCARNLLRRRPHFQRG